MTNAERFKLLIATDSNNTWGWNGWVLDKQTGIRYGLIKTVVDYVVQDEVGYAHCAFDTKAELVAAAKRKARTLVRCIVCGTDLKTDRGNIPYCPKCDDAWAESGLDPHFRRAIRELGLIATAERDPKVREGIDRAIEHLKSMAA
jgi:hypothetical protein